MVNAWIPDGLIPEHAAGLVVPPLVNCKRESSVATALPFNVKPAVEENPLPKLIDDPPA